MRHAKLQKDFGHSSCLGHSWLNRVTALWALLTFSGVSVAIAGHGDAEDAVFFKSSAAVRKSEGSTVRDFLAYADKVRRDAIVGLKAHSSNDFLSVLAQDFEMRLCECRSHEQVVTQDNLDIAPQTEQPEIAVTIAVSSKADEPPAKVLDFQTLSPTYRFTREDMLMSNLLMNDGLPVGSFVSKLTIEEYRPYDLLDTPIALASPSLVPPTASDVNSSESLTWAPRIRSEKASSFISGYKSENFQTRKEIFAQKVGETVKHFYQVLSDTHRKAELYLAGKVNSSVSKMSQIFEKSQYQLLSLSKSQLLLQGFQFVRGQSLGDSLHQKPSQVSSGPIQRGLAGSQLRKLFGSTIICNPLETERFLTRSRPPMLTAPTSDEEILDSEVASSNAADTNSSESKRELVVLLQDASWDFFQSDWVSGESRIVGLSDSTIDNSGPNHEKMEIGSLDSASESTQKVLEGESTGASGSDLAEGLLPETPAKSASRGENAREGLSQR